MAEKSPLELAYAIIDLHPKDARESGASGINSRGDVLLGADGIPYRWRNGESVVLQGDGATASDINDAGMVAGSIVKTEGGTPVTTAAFWSPTSQVAEGLLPLLSPGPIDPSVPPNTAYATLAGSGGKIYGYSMGHGCSPRPVQWDASKPKERPSELPNIGGHRVEHITDIGSDDSLIGDLGPESGIGFVGSEVLVGVVPVGIGSAKRKSPETGSEQCVVGKIAKGVYFRFNGKQQPLPNCSEAITVNKDGLVLGKTPLGQSAVWQKAEIKLGIPSWRMTLIEDAIPKDSGWSGLILTAVNAQGVIVGSGSYRGQRRALLLLPILTEIEHTEKTFNYKGEELQALDSLNFETLGEQVKFHAAASFSSV